MYKYIGGPLYNFDASITRGINKSSLWGRETFQGVYSFLASLLHIDQFSYRINLPSSYINGINMGNVYTMYYMFFEDFGYAGLLLVFPISIYYIISYNKLIDFSADRSPLSINMFVYSYMFNALVMLLFSNRFYENMFSYNFLKLLISFGVIWFLITRVRIKARVSCRSSNESFSVSKRKL